jgi:pimeloyl-ACP methyl ester carboxylesterase
VSQIQSVPLHFVESGAGDPPLVILHGLFGSSRNWTQVSRALSANRRVLAVDQRNHGDSPHAEPHSLDGMRADLLALFESLNLNRAVLLGHSMGGMTAMSFASAYPERVAALIVVDIAPRAYPPHHQHELAALSVDATRFADRSAIDAAMAEFLPDPATRQFLQMNLVREASGYRWKLNVSALNAARATEDFGDSDAQFAGPTLFVAGGRSRYIRPEDHATIVSRFPAAIIETIPEGDHWLHYTAQARFLEIVSRFLDQL